MIELTKDIRSLTDFKRNTAEFLENLKRTKHPLILTVNGIVILDKGETIKK
jgi:hypothetical protein